MDTEYTSRIENVCQCKDITYEPLCNVSQKTVNEYAYEYSYNSRYLLRDGHPWFPVMGEMHYSRYREELWEESLRKMKAGGVGIVSTYVIWIHHEEEEGIFDFTGCRNLKGFLEACRKAGVLVFLRLGPWVHGEVRNGGFPDWIQAKEREGVGLRSNDPVYLDYVRRYWERVFEHAKGFLHGDGGPVIGVQIENEYGHVGGLKGEAGEAHMRALTAMAKEIGFRVPLYTATGWGGACIGDLLPVMGGYCEAPWDQRTTELEPNANFVFSYARNDAQIACDHHTGEDITFDESRYPFLTAELGGGLQVTSHRRPVAEGKDIGAMSIARLGSGAALLGYYMYHGGSNPKGKLSTLQESRATRYANDLPEINYDFNAPIRQYGTISDTYREIRLLALFLKDFGGELAAMETEIHPPEVRPGDFHTLRLSCRHDEKGGYIFFNNYQRRHRMDRHPNVVLTGICGDGEVQFPAVDIEDGEYGFFPYRMQLGDACLCTALATPLCRLRTKKGDAWVFYGDYVPEAAGTGGFKEQSANCPVVADGAEEDVTACLQGAERLKGMDMPESIENGVFIWKGETRADILKLSRREALSAQKLSLDQDYLILSEGFVWEEEGKVRVTGGKDTLIRCFPRISGEMLPGFAECGQEGRFTVYERKVDDKTATAEMSLILRNTGMSKYEVLISYNGKRDRQAGRDTILQISYSGERMEIYAEGEKVNDHFYTGQEVTLSLGYFDFPPRLEIVVYPLKENTAVFLEKWPEMEGGCACRLDKVAVTEQYW